MHSLRETSFPHIQQNLVGSTLGMGGIKLCMSASGLTKKSVCTENRMPMRPGRVMCKLTRQSYRRLRLFQVCQSTPLSLKPFSLQNIRFWQLKSLGKLALFLVRLITHVNGLGGMIVSRFISKNNFRHGPRYSASSSTYKRHFCAIGLWLPARYASPNESGHCFCFSRGSEVATLGAIS